MLRLGFWLLLVSVPLSSAFTPPAILATTVASSTASGAETGTVQQLDVPVNQVVTRVAVAGATGRVGRLVVEELLSRGVQEVVALVRDVEAAEEILGGTDAPANLQITQCNLSSKGQISSVLNDVDAMIWCATGFSQKPNAGPLEKAKGLLDLAMKKTIDVTALPVIGNVIKENNLGGKNPQQLPKVVMCSSAGVTRTIWDDEKKALMPGAADIPIVRLNPFGALDIKRSSEDKLRETGVDYTVVRPCGLNDEHPVGSRPLLSQGDVAVGRINRKDVARVLVDCLTLPEATGKTFEVIGVAGYPFGSIRGALSNLRSDEEGLPPLDAIVSTYTTLQQLLPGEKQDSAALAMGQTYEQLDKDEVGRLGERGKEILDDGAPRPSS
ncbi:TIC 62, chloroplastic [Seminavis robusta]|uniref:TIC 62, chloroplastic n=1 Tax=Seminavis robusta TaxID=568900 RepID=A0A9N8DL00_9STRA|nr:TIC 62, chloroplastic [Seminavis robusta]|eukprot:Sro140_g065360.1 TIC 62, chloroplastic (383) ;mRNA; f:18463-19742